MEAEKKRLDFTVTIVLIVLYFDCSIRDYTQAWHVMKSHPYLLSMVYVRLYRNNGLLFLPIEKIIVTMHKAYRERVTKL